MRKNKIGKGEARINIRDLLHAGLLSAGEELTCEPRKGEVYKATLAEDGNIVYLGSSFESPSDWASKVAGNSRNGWRDTSARGQLLHTFREQYRSLKRSPMVSADANTWPMPGQPTSNQDSHRESSGPSRLSAPEAIGTLQLRSATPSRSNQDSTQVTRGNDKPQPSDDEKKLSGTILDTLKSLPPKGFQDFVIKRLLPSLGMTNVTVRQFVKDGGIDGEGLLEISEETVIAGITEKSSKRAKCAIQVKRWGAGISRPDVQTFRGAISGQFDRGLFVTTSYFSKEALEEARRGGVIPITAIDGDNLSRLLIEKSLGVKEVTVKIVDLDFFAL